MASLMAWIKLVGLNAMQKKSRPTFQNWHSLLHLQCHSLPSTIIIHGIALQNESTSITNHIHVHYWGERSESLPSISLSSGNEPHFTSGFIRVPRPQLYAWENSSEFCAKLATL
jgi:hypothetical protein